MSTKAGILFFLFCGSALASYFYYTVARNKIAGWLAVMGKVVEISKELQSDIDEIARYYYAARIQFRTRTGETTIWQDPFSSIKEDFQVGQSVRILYNPHDATEAVIPGWRTYWEALVLAIAASFFLLTFLITLFERH